MRLFIILLVLCSMPVLAEDLLISEETHEHGTNISFAGNSHILFIIDAEAILLDSAEATREIELGECIDSEDERLCYSDSIDNTSAGLTRYRREAIVDITHSINTSTLLVGEEREQRITVENSGNIPVQDFTLILNIPEDMKLTESMYCESQEGTISWEDSIEANDSETCRYTIRALREGTFTINGSMSYESANSSQEESIQGYTLSAQFPFSLSINATTPMKGGPFNLSVRLDGNRSENISLEELTLTETTKALHEGEPIDELEILEDRIIGPNTTFARTLGLVNLASRPYTLPLAVSYETDHTYEFTYPVHIHPMNDTLAFNISTNSPVTQLEDLVVNIRKKVLNRNLKYSSPHVTLEGMEALETNFSLEEQDTVRSTIPANHGSGTHDLRISIRYNDSEGDSYELTRTESIEVRALKEPRIEKTLISNESARRATLIINLTNRLPFEATFSISELNPLGTEEAQVAVPAGNTTQALRVSFDAEDIADAPPVMVSNTSVRYSVESEELAHHNARALHFSDIRDRWEETNQTNESAQQMDTNQKSRKIAWIGGLVIVLIAGGGGLLYLKRSRKTGEEASSGEDNHGAAQKEQEQATREGQQESGEENTKEAPDEGHRTDLINRAQELEEQLNQELNYIEDPRETDKAMELETEYRRTLQDLHSLDEKEGEDSS